VTVSEVKGKISWNAVDSDGVASSTLKIDGVAVSNVGGPYSAAPSPGVNFSASYGSLAAGTHAYIITATDKAGNVSTSNGSFTTGSSNATYNALFASASRSALPSSAKVDWVYDLGGLLDTQSSSDNKSTANAVDAVLAGY
jgi:hypothetical protein